MRGVVASVTSCIGGKDERYAVKIQPLEHERYFVYKSMGEFEALWAKIEAIAAEAKLKQKLFEDDGASQDVGVLAKWLMSFVDHFAFRTQIEQLRDQGKETITPLNVLLQALVRRVAALYVENTILRCGCCQVGRQLALLMRNFLEYAQTEKRTMKSLVEATRCRKRAMSIADLCPENDAALKRAIPMFPTRDGVAPPLPKIRKLSTVASQEFKPLAKIELDVQRINALSGRRRVFAEVDF